ncbi:hypothetical protein [Vaginisenegalia massiliensis]|uniref:hypothetical protein n=1 Tax=Vaginisenegalia massiliensis TaxID=2058294 RepID=UPI000F53CDBE|nr:hypothetical protein [Vaginisenegalia massiliensis]
MPKTKPSKVLSTKQNEPPYMKTDYDIPKFGYKAALVMLSGIMLVWLGLPSLLKWLGIDYYWGMILIGGFLCGFIVAFTQYFIQTKQGFSRRFWLVTVLWSLFIGCLILLFLVSGVLM